MQRAARRKSLAANWQITVPPFRVVEKWLLDVPLDELSACSLLPRGSPAKAVPAPSEARISAAGGGKSSFFLGAVDPNLCEKRCRWTHGGSAHGHEKS